MLREEAERERRARETESPTGASASTPRATVTPLAPLSGEEMEDEDGSGAPRMAARRDLLPDIEQINSTLRATGATPDQGAAAVAMTPPQLQAEHASGFRIGFRIAVILVALILVLYVLAPAISQRVPALAPAMSALTATIDSYRAWIDRLLLRAVAGLRSGG